MRNEEIKTRELIVARSVLLSGTFLGIEIDDCSFRQVELVELGRCNHHDGVAAAERPVTAPEFVDTLTKGEVFCGVESPLTMVVLSNSDLCKSVGRTWKYQARCVAETVRTGHRSRGRVCQHFLRSCPFSNVGLVHGLDGCAGLQCKRNEKRMILVWYVR